MQTLLTNKPVEEAPVKKSLKYQRLIDRSRELIRLGKKSRDEEIMMEDDSLCHVFECEGLLTYEKIASYAKAVGAKRIIDIGCAYGHQSEVFLNEGLQYVGVTDHSSPFWNRDKFEYVVNRYPCELPIQKGDIGVSVLCMTWNVYLREGKKTLIEQCEALQRDFEHCLIYTQESHVEVLSSFFKHVKQIDGHLYYYSNK
jgi:hypothetical protein